MLLVTLPRTCAALLNALSLLWPVQQSEARPEFKKMDALTSRSPAANATSYTVHGVVTQQAATSVTYTFVGDELSIVTVTAQCPQEEEGRKICSQEWSAIRTQLRDTYGTPTRNVEGCLEEWRLASMDVVAFRAGSLFIGRPTEDNRELVESFRRASRSCSPPRKGER